MTKQIARVTNMWTKILDGEQGAWFSQVVVESTRPYNYHTRDCGNRVIFTGKGAVLNMPAETAGVNDGLLRELAIRQENQDAVLLEITLEHPTQFRQEAVPGFPFRLKLSFDRSVLTGLFRGKKIVIDPGHGGTDTGGRGPVGLREKDVVLAIAKNLEGILRRAGAEVILTRNGDEDVTREQRLALVKQSGAGVFIGIHNKCSAGSNEDGAATRFAPTNRESAVLAGYIQKELIAKLKAADRGVAEQPELLAHGAIPAVEVDVLTITNLVEEVFLRGLTVRQKAAEGIFNGLSKYFAWKSKLAGGAGERL